MKKILFIFLFCVLSLKFEVFPTYAISFSDIFPPLKMSNDPVYGNPPATDIKTVGPQGVSDNSYVNKLDDPENCPSTVTVSGSWSAKQDDIWDEIKQIFETIFRYPYNAPDLNNKKEWTKISNAFSDLVGKKWTNRGTASPDPETNAANFKQIGMAGYGALDKTLGIQLKKCLQGQALEQMFRTFDEEDTDYPDLQRAWDCGGKFVAIGDADYGSCRPITIGEIAYFYSLHPEIYKDDPLVFDSCETMNPRFLPDMSGYPGIYKNNTKTKGKKYNLTLLPGDIGTSAYKILRDQLPIKALGPSNQKINVTNYGSVDQSCADSTCSNGLKPGSPTITKINRLLPAGSSAGNPNLTNFMTSVTNPKTVAKKFSCGDVKIIENNPEVQDTPSIVKFAAFVIGLVRKGIRDEPNWDWQHKNPLVVKTSSNYTKQIEQTAGDFFNMIPNNYEQRDRLLNEPASSKSCPECPIDPGNQSAEIQKIMAKYLLPASWQKL